MFINLSDSEKSLIADAEIMLTKNRIIEKVVQLFQHVYGFYQPIVEEYLPAFFATNGKISKGEKYEGLPYVVLDYPRSFTRDHVFAIRSLFWWGNDMSVSLHVSGKYQHAAANCISESIAAGKLNDWHLQVAGNPWQHAVRHPFEMVDPYKDYQLQQAPFIKLAKKIPLAEWDNSDKLFVETFQFLADMLYAPMR